MMTPRLSTRPVARRSRPRRERVRSIPGIEVLENRVVLSVTAVLNGTTLDVHLGAGGDTAVVLGRNAIGAVAVNGQIFNKVAKIEVAGNGGPSQVVQFTGTLIVGSDLTVNRVSEVRIDGTCEIGDLTIELSNHPGGILGAGGVIAHGDTSLRAPGGDVALTGPNDFRTTVSVVAQNATLNDVGLLKLRRLRVLHDASLTSRSLDVIDPSGDVTSVERGSLILQPASPDESMDIGGYTGDYSLPKDDLYAFGGFGRLTIGRADGKNKITIRDVLFTADATIRTPLGGSISVVDRNLRSYGPNLTLSAPQGQIRLDGDVIYSGNGLLRFDGPVALGKPKVSVLASQGSMEFAGAINDVGAPSVLKLEAGARAGNITLDGPVGDRAALGGLWIVEARNLHLKGAVSAGFVRQEIGIGTTTIDGAILATPTADRPMAVDIASTRLVLNGRIQAPGRTVRLWSQKGIVDQGGVSAGSLAIEGEGTFKFLDPKNEVSTLATRTGGPVEFFNSQDLTIGSVGSVHGIYSFGHAVSLQTTGTLSFGQGGATSVLTGVSPLTLSAKNIVENPGSLISTRALIVRQAGNVDLNARRNEFGTVSASIAGSIAVSDYSNLTVADRGGVNGIRTTGGDVSILARGTLVVDAPVNTQPGAGGVLRVLGKPQKVRVNVAPVLGAGNITLTAD
ncbi:MAG: hypothetical protein P4L85_03965 [Paludisphaera borealis]|uniref:hypothetical protein n=1 Tax=Paludisphaera borealis TaxID=1387353 RepID=UPI0028411A28|nr:hypothetical protein [Paludisphaera borealis]MDR3618483.1 hypothetical protein [Paludisphaera borealis]